MTEHKHPYPLPNELDELLGSHDDGDVLREMWDVSGMLGGVTPDPQRSAVRLSVLRTARKPASHLRLVPVYLYRISSVAAAIIVAVILSFLLSPQTQVLRADRGIAATVHTLPDGSTATLAAGSRIAFEDSFGAEGVGSRTVRLLGRAYFDVEKTGTPFRVVTYNSVTEVLGTTFSVEAWPNDVEAGSEVVVTSGRVAVQGNGPVIELDPGEAVSIQGGAQSPTPSIREVDRDRSVSWRTGGLAYENEPIGNVLRDLERRFDITLSAPASIRLRRISYWKQHASDASEAVGDVAATVGVRYRPVKDGFELYLP